MMFYGGAAILVEGKRVKCPYCSLIVGNLDEGGGKPLMSEQHDAPCGRRCVGSSRRYWPSDDVDEPLHTGMATCSICKPRTCPACNGRKHVNMTAREAIDRGLATPAVQRMKNGDLMVAPKCPRCSGRGWVDGVEA